MTTYAVAAAALVGLAACSTPAASPPAPAAPAPPPASAAPPSAMDRISAGLRCARAERFLPGVVSMDGRSEIKLTHSPDGKLWLFGVIEKADDGSPDWNIHALSRDGGAWSASSRVPFNSTSNDFDPFFAPDGSGVYFFSNRPGGAGGDDLYFVPYSDGTWGTAQALAALNTKGDEWAPVTDPAHRELVFSTDGRGGAGRHDLFRSRRIAAGWSAPEPIAALNTPLDDYDAAFVDGGHLLFARGDLSADQSRLFLGTIDGAEPATPLPEALSPADGFVLGPWFDGANSIYFSSYRPDHKEGRVDIFSVDLSAACPGPNRRPSPR